jgi:DNA repair photolyase
MVLRLFKPGKNLMCTTLKKYALNTYSGCPYDCLYCYASAFFGHGLQKTLDGRFVRNSVKPKYQGMIKKLQQEVKTKQKLPVYISPLIDPYNPAERKYRITRKAIQILSEHNFPLIITTKSDVVLDDLEILEKSKSVVSFTITTLDKQKSKIIEPYAPSPEKRLNALRELAKKVPTTVRIQPIIPFFNDQEDEIEELIREARYSGAKHITSGTFKLIKPAFEKLKLDLPEVAEKLEELYFKNPDRRWNYYYAPKNIRYKIMKKVARLAEKHKLTFGCCREGFLNLNTSTCDGQAIVS